MSIRVHPAELHKQSLTSSCRAVNLLVSGADGSDFCLIKLHRESLFLHETMSSVMFVYSRTFLYSWETFRSSSPEDLKKKQKPLLDSGRRFETFRHRQFFPQWTNLSSVLCIIYCF